MTKEQTTDGCYYIAMRYVAAREGEAGWPASAYREMAEMFSDLAADMEISAAGAIGPAGETQDQASELRRAVAAAGAT